MSFHAWFVLFCSVMIVDVVLVVVMPMHFFQTSKFTLVLFSALVLFVFVGSDSTIDAHHPQESKAGMAWEACASMCLSYICLLGAVRKLLLFVLLVRHWATPFPSLFWFWFVLDWLWCFVFGFSSVSPSQSGSLWSSTLCSTGRLPCMLCCFNLSRW